MAGYNDPETGYAQGGPGNFTLLSHITDITNKFDKDATPASGDVPTWNGTVYVPAGATIQGAVNIKSAPYNAVGNYNIGTATGADDTDAITSAITAALALGLSLFVPPGTYKCTFRGQDATDTSMKWAFFLSSPLEIWGVGPASIFYTPDTSTTLFWVEGAASGGRFRNLRLIGSGLTSPHRSTAVRLKGTTGWDVDHCVIESWGTHNVHLQDSTTRCRVHHNLIKTSIAWNGVEIKDGCTRNQVYRNIITSSNDQGVEIRNATNNQVGWNIIIDSGLAAPSGPNSGIGLENGAHRNEVCFNQIYNSRLHAIQILASTAASDDNWIHHNHCEGNVATDDLIVVKADQPVADGAVGIASRNRIEFNTCQGSLRYGILVRAAVATVLRGNKTLDSAHNGIRVESWQWTVSSVLTRFKPTDTLVNGNEVYHAGDDGIYVSFADEVRVLDNIVTVTTHATPVASAIDAIYMESTVNPMIRGNRASSFRYGFRGTALTLYLKHMNNFTGNLTAAELIDGGSTAGTP